MRVRWSQHFLTSPAVAGRMIEAVELKPGEEVVEIGPGRGRLTERLLAAGARVTAVEIDPRLHERLARRFGAALRLLRADFLEVEPGELPPRPKFVANLPYAVATPILQRILSWPDWSLAVLMFQKEVGERIVAAPGDGKYGILSVSVALKSRAELVCGVPAGAFTPRPKVDSAIMRFERKADPLAQPGPDEERLMTLVRAAFGHRRKTAANSVALALGVPRAGVEEALRRAGIAPNARAQELSLEQFRVLSAELYNMGSGPSVRVS